MGELSSLQPLQPRPLREAARKSPKCGAGREWPDPRELRRVYPEIGKVYPGVFLDLSGLGGVQGPGLKCTPGVSPSVLSGAGHGVLFTPWVPWDAGVDANVSLPRSPSPPCPPPQGWTLAPLPAHSGCHGDPNVTSAARSHKFRVCGVRAFSRRSPTPMAGPGVGGDPRPLTPHRVRDLREPRAAAEGVSPFGSGADPDWGGWGDPGGPGA